ncbi:hypothetical protein DTW90_28860 [Neorhizobium sp. P12A]|uniref:hypothetical protein n=1 Tax=Neorhizobium sp. P12A TaxID=2268027 RepID=UPI0011EFBF53|nr:hypothetical protein [Neorhizobium sp. P12A]KAA0690919.1 hypothetical protein DTW90_28860 [Neorhizobium sp. P12A]
MAAKGRRNEIHKIQPNGLTVSELCIGTGIFGMQTDEDLKAKLDELKNDYRKGDATAASRNSFSNFTFFWRLFAMAIIGSTVNRRFVLAKRPESPTSPASRDLFELQSVDVPELADGEFLVESHWMSLDPWIRGTMNGNRSYQASVELGDVTAGIVLAAAPIVVIYVIFQRQIVNGIAVGAVKG